MSLGLSSGIPRRTVGRASVGSCGPSKAPRGIWSSPVIHAVTRTWTTRSGSDISARGPAVASGSWRLPRERQGSSTSGSRLLLDEPELVSVGILEHRVRAPVFLRRRRRELDAELAQRLFFLLHVLRDEGDPGVPRFQRIESLAQVKGHVLVLRAHRDPMALMVSDFEAELLCIPLGRFLRIGHDESDCGEAHHGRGDSLAVHKGSGLAERLMAPRGMCRTWRPLAGLRSRRPSRGSSVRARVGTSWPSGCMAPSLAARTVRIPMLTCSSSFDANGRRSITSYETAS